MIRAIFICTIILIIANKVSAQDDYDLDKMVGYGCSYEGATTKPVIKVTRLLNRRNYNGISKLLTSPQPAERYLAVITLERLSKLKKYSLTEQHLERIATIKNSNDMVSVCSGCTYFVTMTLRDSFEDETWKGISEYWLESRVRKD